MSAWEHARLALRYTPGRVLGWALVLAAAVRFLTSLAGCSAPVWPSACPLTDGARRCTCRTWTERVTSLPGKPRPAGRVGYECDGVPLPITVEAEDVGP